MDVITKINGGFCDVENLNFPSKSVVAPSVVPLTTTVAPISVSLLFSSFITPEISCALTMK